MKKIFTFPNIQAAILFLLSVAETVIMLIFKPLPIIGILLAELGMLLCIAVIRFAYPIAYFGNTWRSLWTRKNSSVEDDEPSELAVGLTKACGYFILFGLQIVLFL